MRKRIAAVVRYAQAHPRALVVGQVVVLTIFLGSVGWALRGTLRDAGDDLRNADPWYFLLACAAMAGYYLVFVLGWMVILRDWGIRISYPVSLRSELVSMLAKYVPGAVWMPAARVVAARRAGITDGALVTVSMLVEAGISAVAGVAIFMVSLAWVDGSDAPVALLVGFAAVLAILLHPRIFRALVSRVLRKLGYPEVPPLRGRTMALLFVFYCITWILGGVALWLLLRSVGAHPDTPSIVYLGGVAAVGAIVAVVSVFAPSGLGPREGAMYALILAITSSKSAALSATVLNRLALTLVEVLLLVLAGLVFRRGGGGEEAEPALGPSRS